MSIRAQDGGPAESDQALRQHLGVVVNALRAAGFATSTTQMCGLRVEGLPVSGDSEAWARLAPGGVAAGDGWVECTDRLVPLRRGEALPKDLATFPLLSAELVLADVKLPGHAGEAAAQSLHLRRDGERLFLTSFMETQSPRVESFGPRLFRQRRLQAHGGVVLVYHVYWAPSAMAQHALRPEIARLASVEWSPTDG